MDYFKILDFNKEPFSNSPDPDVFYQSRQHQGCLQKLEISIRLHRGLNVIIGDVGTGKTTLCRQLIRKFAGDDTAESHLILDPHFSDASEFLTAVARVLGGHDTGEKSTDWQLKENIKKYLFSRGVDEEKKVLLIIDEGQKLPDFCLELLREFLNYETNDKKLLQIVIFAQKEFEKKISRYEKFRDRINLYHHLNPLSFRDACSLINFRLNQASESGTSSAKFSLPAFISIYWLTNGYPRKIINLCHQIILSLIIKNNNRAGWYTAYLCGKKAFPESSKRQKKVGVGALTATVIILLSLSLWPGGRFSLLNRNNDSQRELQLKEEPVIADKSMTIETPSQISIQSQDFAELSQNGTAEAAQTYKNEYVFNKNDEQVNQEESILGTVTIQENETLGELIRKIYGPYSFTPENMESVLKINPQINNPHWIQPGKVINFPILQVDFVKVPENVFQIQVTSKKTLEETYQYIRKHRKDLPPFLIIKSKNIDEPYGFKVVLEKYFFTIQSAKTKILELPEGINTGSVIINRSDKS